MNLLHLLGKIVADLTRLNIGAVVIRESPVEVGRVEELDEFHDVTIIVQEFQVEVCFRVFHADHQPVLSVNDCPAVLNAGSLQSDLVAVDVNQLDVRIVLKHLFGVHHHT